MIATQTLVDNMKKELGSFFSTEAHTDNDYLRYINSSVRDICLVKEFPFNKYKTTVTIASPGVEYDIPYQIQTFALLNADSIAVTLKDFEEYYMQQNKGTTVGIWEDKIVSDTTGTYTLLYRGFPDSITSINSSVQVPDHFFDLLVVRGTYYGFMDLKDYAKAGEKAQVWTGMVKSIAARNANKLPNGDVRLGESYIF